MKSKLLILLLFFIVGCAQAQNLPTYTNYIQYPNKITKIVYVGKVISKSYTETTEYGKWSKYSYRVGVKVQKYTHYAYSWYLYDAVDVGDYVQIVIYITTSEDTHGTFPIYLTIE